MSNIVERLREQSQILESFDLHRPSVTMSEAADEIETLKAKLRHVQGALRDVHTETRMQLRSDINEVLKALELTLQRGPHTGLWVCARDTYATMCRRYRSPVE